MDRKKREYKAYMTVEASLLMPMLLSGIVLILFLCFYLYNSCLIRQVAYTAALRGSLIREGSSSWIESYTYGELEKLVAERLLAVQERQEEVTVSVGAVKVEVSMKMAMPFGTWLSDKIGLWEFEEEASAARLNPVSIIRGLRLAGG